MCACVIAVVNNRIPDLVKLDVGIILLYMIEEAARSIENTEIPIADMLWVASE